jgi:hypothetical protein
MKRFWIFALAGPLIMFLCSLIFRFVMAWGGGGGLQAIVQSLFFAFALGLPPLLVAFYVNGMDRWTTWPSRLKATASAGFAAGIVYTFVGAMIGGGRIATADYILFPLFGLLLGAIAAVCALIAHRVGASSNG